MQNNISRLDSIDIAKGIGIILVVCSHSVYPQFMYFANLFFIPLFFVLAGYTFHTLSFYKKATSLLKPYLFFNIIIAVTMCLSHIRDFSWVHFKGILYSRYALYPLEITDSNCILMNIGNSPTWFLTCMFVSFILLYFIIHAKKKTYWLLSVYLLITYILNECPILLPWGIDIAFLMAIFIYSGMIMKRKGLIYLSHNYLIGLIPLYFVLSYLNGYCNLSVRNYGNSIILLLIGGLVGSYIVLRISFYLEHTFLKKILVPIGQNSLVIFCIQIPLLFIIKKVFTFIMLNFGGSVHIVFLSTLQIIFTICIGFLVSRFLYKYMPTMIR